MATGIKGQFPITFRVAFELRYRFGFTYLDRCGRTINLIQRTLPEWIFLNQQPNPQNTPLVSSENSCRLSFSSQQLDMGITKAIGETAIGDTDLTRFAEQVEQITSIITDQLSLDDFSRIGARIWYLFPFGTREESDLWLRSLGFCSVSAALEAAFGGKAETISLGIAISSADRRFRVGCDTVERAVAMDLGDAVLNVPIHQLATEKDEHGKNRRSSELLRREKIKKQVAHNPPFAAMIDVDAAQDDPELIHPGDFVRDSFKQSWERLKNAIG